MVTAIAILSGACLLLVLLSLVLAFALSLAVAELNDSREDEMNLPNIKWDYTSENGWVDAEAEDVAEP